MSLATNMLKLLVKQYCRKYGFCVIILVLGGQNEQADPYNRLVPM